MENCARPSCANFSETAGGLCAPCVSSEKWAQSSIEIAHGHRLDEVFPERVEERYAVTAAPLAPVIGPNPEGTRYGIAALRAICARLLDYEGGRNDGLFRAAAQTGELVAGGQLDGDYAYRILIELGHQIAPDERVKSRNTIERGLRTGFKRPRVPQA